MRTTAQRKAAYDAKVDPATVGLKRAAVETLAKSGYAARINSLVQKEMEGKVVLDAEGVTIIQYPFYLSFVREIWRKVIVVMLGEAVAIAEATNLQAKYVNYGLDATILRRLALDCFNIAIP